MKIKLNELMLDRLIEAQQWLDKNENLDLAIKNNYPLGLFIQPDFDKVKQCSREVTVCANEFNDLIRFIEAVEVIRESS